MTELLELFMRESNWIEGERDTFGRGLLHPSDLHAAWDFLETPLTAASLKELHYRLSGGRDILRGQYRDCQVYVGNHTPPAPALLPSLMEEFFEDLVGMSSYRAHIEFEKIHPFEDLNGRTGRLLWLHLWLRDHKGYDIPASFLQMFYYQTLDHDRSK